jgi:hypothetical protein
MNFDHLSQLPDKLAGVVVSTKPLPNGLSMIIKPDDVAFTDRRFVGHSAEVAPPNAEVKPGTRVSFLPGSPTRRGRMPRAYEIEIASDNQTGLPQVKRAN